MYVAVVGSHSYLPEPAALGVLKLIEVLLCEGAHRGNTCRARRGGDEHYVLLGDCGELTEERAYALSVTLCFLVDEGELLDVLEGLDVLGLNACLVERTLVVGSVVVCELDYFLQVLKLSLFEFLAGERFELLVPEFAVDISAHCFILHNSYLAYLFGMFILYIAFPHLSNTIVL